MVTRSKINSLKPKTFIVTSPSFTEPSTFKQAAKNSKWVKAMKDEIRALQINNTLILVSSDSSQNLIGCKWVYRVK